MEENNDNQAKWNIDGAELYLLFEIKEKFTILMDSWDLENAYWRLRSFRREVDAALKRQCEKENRSEIEKQVEEEKRKEGRGKTNKETEKDEIDILMKFVDKAREKYQKSEKTDENKSEFYICLEEMYMKICYMMKLHGMYFREGRENTGLAIFRR